MNMASRELTNLVKDLSQKIINAPDELQPRERNEEWTKVVLILPLLEGLGWDRATDVGYESSPQDIEGSLDYVLKCQPPIGVEAKALDVKYSLDHNHKHVEKGLKQSKDRGASYFIWTNGDCWQFYSLALENAPVYQVILSRAGGGSEQAESIVNKLRIIEKEHFTENPEIFDEAIRNNWKIAALPAAWNSLFEKDMSPLLQLVGNGLPAEIEIKNEEILEFLRTLRTSDDFPEYPRSRTKKPKKSRSFPDDWDQLLSSYEPDYDKARKKFSKGYNLKLAQYVISENYKPWSKSTTWRHIGMPNDSNEKKKSGPVITLFREWRFIEEVGGTDRYKRVEESVPYLKKLLE
jgi:predicted type IV restriction endonuclease